MKVLQTFKSGIYTLASITILFLFSVVVAACGDARVEGSINTQPGASWQFQGNIEAIEAPYWIVSKQRILVNDKTYIEGTAPPAVGLSVSVEGRTLDNGTPNALMIKIIRPGALPTVTPLVEASSDSWNAITPIPIPASALAGKVPEPTPAGNPAAQAVAASAATAAVPPPGTFVEIEDVIQQVKADPNFTIITVLDKPYILESYMVRIVGRDTVIGARIKFTARYNNAGQAIITKVVWIKPPAAANPALPINPAPVNNSIKGNDKKGEEKKGDH